MKYKINEKNMKYKIHNKKKILKGPRPEIGKAKK